MFVVAPNMSWVFVFGPSFVVQLFLSFIELQVKAGCFALIYSTLCVCVFVCDRLFLSHGACDL